jgi:hypothetical protein
VSRYIDQLKDSNGQLLAEVTVYVYTYTGELAALEDGDGEAIANPLTTDAYGNFDFYADDGLYTLKFLRGDRVIFEQQGVIVGEPAEQFKGDPGANVMAVGTFAGLSAMNIPVGTDRIRASNGADYVYDAAVDSAYVAAHPLSAKITLNGRGFRLATDGPWINILHLQGNTVPGTTDFVAAVNAAVAMVSAGNEHNLPGGPTIWFPPGVYRFSGAINLKKQVILCGGSNGMAGAGQSTSLHFAAGVHGIIINHPQTDNGDTIVAFGGQAGGTILRNLDLYGAKNGVTYDGSHGIYAKSRCILENTSARNFGGHGLYIAGDGNIAVPATYGNANCSRVTGGHFEGNLGDGIRIEGGDANVVTVTGTDCSYNDKYGVANYGFLGNIFIGCHTAENGVYRGAGLGRPHPAIVNHGGDQYYVVDETLAPTTTPGTNAAVWKRMPDEYVMGVRGTPSTAAPAWASGTVYAMGGCYISTSNAGDTVFVGCYAETGQAPPYLVDPALAIGGQLSAVEGGGAWLQMDQGVLLSNQTVGYQRKDATSTQWSRLGGPQGSGVLWAYGDSVKGPQGWTFQYNGNDFILEYAADPANSPYTITGLSTTEQFGTGVNKPFRMRCQYLGLGVAADSRLYTTASAAPTTGAHARGEIVFNNAPSAAGKVGWVCVTAGTPGTWKPFGAIDA